MGLLETFNSRNTKRRRRNLPLALRHGGSFGVEKPTKDSFDGEKVK